MKTLQDISFQIPSSSDAIPSIISAAKYIDTQHVAYMTQFSGVE